MTEQGYAVIRTMVGSVSARLRVQFKNPSCVGLQGSIDGVQSGTLRGWARDGDGRTLALIVKKNGVYLGECTANALRADLAALGMGDGRCGFSLPVPRDFAVQLGDVLEVIDAARPSRRMALKMTRRVVARPGWKGPFANGTDSQRQNGSHSKNGTPAVKPVAITGLESGINVDELASRYARLADENRQLRAQAADYEMELRLNLLQLRQVQEELESWFLKYQELEARQAAAAPDHVQELSSSAQSPTHAGGGRS